MKNYKIKVNRETTKEAQILLEQLGYTTGTGCGLNHAVWLFAESNGTVNYSSTDVFISDIAYQELTLPQLRDLVVLHRNDVKDANYLYGQRLVLKLETQDYKIWDLSKLEWVDHVGSQTDLRNGITRIQLPRTKDQGLISGADAKLAWANGEALQIRETGTKEWLPLTDTYTLMVFDYDRYEIRKKPHTIKLELEIPASFEPEVGEKFFYITDDQPSSYACSTWIEINEEYPWIGKWRTEEEIKQVVAALRGIKG